MRANIFSILSVCLASLVISGCMTIPFMHFQKEPITPFSGRVVPAQEVFVLVEGHPETMTTSDEKGKFITKWGDDFYFGMDSAYYEKAYILLFKQKGEVVGFKEVVRPELIGRYPDVGKYNQNVIVDVGIIHLENEDRLHIRDQEKR